MTTLITGGAGYIGVPTCHELLRSGRRVRVLDVLLHGQADVAHELAGLGVEVLHGDARDAGARAEALAGADEVVHLAAIVGDPACARDPETAHEVNVVAARTLAAEAARAGVQRLVFASTCSNYGRMSDPRTPIDEGGELAPVSLYAEQKVGIERMLLDPAGAHPPSVCLRFATVYGVARRMRFDLTVNEFTRDLWVGRQLEVFGEQFWRPYVHVRDAARAIRLVLDAAPERVDGEVFNVGNSGENYRKLDIVEAVRARTANGSVKFVKRDEDPRDYKVAFEKIAHELGYATTMTVPGGIGEVLAALESGTFGDPFARQYRNLD